MADYVVKTEHSEEGVFRGFSLSRDGKPVGKYMSRDLLKDAFLSQLLEHRERSSISYELSDHLERLVACADSESEALSMKNGYFANMGKSYLDVILEQFNKNF